MPYTDRLKQQQYQKEWYLKQRVENSFRRIVDKQKRKAIGYRFANRYKLTFGCCNCGYKKCARALDFHHKDATTKTSTVAKLLVNGAALWKIKEEIRKCDILCSNCHRELHSVDCIY